MIMFIHSITSTTCHVATKICLYIFLSSIIIIDKFWLLKGMWYKFFAQDAMYPNNAIIANTI